MFYSIFVQRYKKYRKCLKSKKDLFRERYSQSYPDLDMDDEEALYGQLNDDYDANESKLKTYEDDRKKLSDLFQSNPQSAIFLSDWANGSNPIIALVKAYGQDFIDYVNDPENAEEIAKAQAEYLEKQAKSKEFDELYAKNTQESLKVLSDMQAEKGLSDDETASVLEKILSVEEDLRQGKITPEILDMFMKAEKYDTDVDEARTEGEIAGKNAKIDNVLKLKSRGDGTPSLQGGNNVADENPIKIEGALGREKQDIWEAGNPKRIRRR